MCFPLRSNFVFNILAAYNNESIPLLIANGKNKTEAAETGVEKEGFQEASTSVCSRRTIKKFISVSDALRYANKFFFMH